MDQQISVKTMEPEEPEEPQHLDERRRRLPLVDRLPEDLHYPDTGCNVHSSCLTCPMPQCVYDETPETRAAAQHERDEAIFRRYLEAMGSGGRRCLDIQSLADHFSVSRRTIHRAIQRIKRERRNRTPEARPETVRLLTGF